MNYTEMLFNRDERLVNLLNQADSKNLELIEEINEKGKEIKKLNNIIEEFEIELEREANIRKEDTDLELNTFITINDTLKGVLKRFKELKGEKE